jgi:hypothetical protein
VQQGLAAYDERCRNDMMLKVAGMTWGRTGMVRG